MGQRGIGGMGMKPDVLATIIGIVRNLPGSETQKAMAAADRAEAAAETAEQHSIGMSLNGTTLVLTSPKEGE